MRKSIGFCTIVCVGIDDGRGQTVGGALADGLSKHLTSAVTKYQLID